MKISLEWLRQYTQVPAEHILTDLSLHTAEVESIETFPPLAHVVVGHVIELIAHQNADKLRIATVETGNATPSQIVCGAKNLEKGMKVPVALPGATLPGDFVIKEVELRGILSQGMICSTDELGLATERAEGIMVLPEDAPVGANVFEYLHKVDTILEIDNKSITNRPDLFGHYGLARECSVIYDLPLAPFASDLPSPSLWENLPKIEVNIATKEMCSRYSALRIENITPKESPLWLSSALEKVGIKSINSIVDVTNYIMMDLGQPLHAFDAKKIEGAIEVGFLDIQEETLTTLDKEERTISDQILLIKDTKKSLALAGIMGLANSAISEETTEILLEAAIFHPTCIRKGAQALALRTDASMRFEKNLDPEMTSPALLKAVALLQSLHPTCVVASQLFDYSREPYVKKSLFLPKTYLQRRIGMEITEQFMLRVLGNLGFEIVESSSDQWEIFIPSWRSTGDISLQEDILEEITRIIGFSDIPPQVPVLPITPNKAQEFVDFTHKMRMYLASALYLQEVEHYSFYSKKAHLDSLLTEETLRVMNPLSSEQEVLRTSLVPGLLHTVQENLKNIKTVQCFELDHVYAKKGEGFWDKETLQSYEEMHLAFVIAAKKSMETMPFLHLKALIEELLEHYAIDKNDIQFVPISTEDLLRAPWAHPKKSAALYIKNTFVGVLGEVHPMALLNYEIDDSHTAIAELNVAILRQMCSEIHYLPVSPYQVTERDLALLMKKEEYVGTILSKLASLHPLLTKVLLLEVYEGDQIAQDMKSVTIRFQIGSSEKTLADKEITEVMDVIKNYLQATYSILLRTS